jgi:hypothetical protein
MIRLIHRWEVLYGHYADFIRQIDDVNAIMRDRGWVQFTPCSPISGKANEVVLVSDYPDYATYKQEEGAAYSDAEFMKAWREGSKFVVQGSGYTEVLEPAPHLA